MPSYERFTGQHSVQLAETLVRLIIASLSPTAELRRGCYVRF